MRRCPASPSAIWVHPCPPILPPVPPGSVCGRKLRRPPRKPWRSCAPAAVAVKFGYGKGRPTELCGAAADLPAPSPWPPPPSPHSASTSIGHLSPRSTPPDLCRAPLCGGAGCAGSHRHIRRRWPVTAGWPCALARPHLQRGKFNGLD
ncbi:hypothetical protein PVAP13_2NG459706 [Panicum virgatum]|uniref:Uncharacterized protein n=1 Tax=Panicum virgatum TaxID=38727 RepID=A0A8T0VHU7_PANVG|nr:hypothetical protein PVAP13_2NG459706 [Panicum virgatum]